MILYSWGFKEYIEDERRELTDEEIRKVNGALLGETEIDD
jgi:hypothetical protein